MRLTKSDCTLNEQDTLQDLLENEKQLIGLYATALFEGSSKSVRKSFSTNLLAVAENQYSLFAQMQSRGYYKPSPAQKQMIDQANSTFKKQQKSLKAE